MKPLERAEVALRFGTMNPSPRLINRIAAAIEAAVAEEREACAALVDPKPPGHDFVLARAAAAIRARS